MNFLLSFHSGLRWIVIVVAVIAIIRFALVWARAMPLNSLDATLMRVYSIALGIQVLVGLTYLIISGINGVGFPGYRIAHAVVMFTAMIVAARSRRAGGEGPLRGRNYLLAVVLSLVLIFVGVALLPGGWSR